MLYKMRPIYDANVVDTLREFFLLNVDFKNMDKKSYEVRIEKEEFFQKKKISKHIRFKSLNNTAALCEHQKIIIKSGLAAYRNGNPLINLVSFLISVCVIRDKN